MSQKNFLKQKEFFAYAMSVPAQDSSRLSTGNWLLSPSILSCTLEAIPKFPLSLGFAQEENRRGKQETMHGP